MKKLFIKIILIFFILQLNILADSQNLNLSGKDLKCPSLNPFTTVFKDLCWG